MGEHYIRAIALKRQCFAMLQCCISFSGTFRSLHPEVHLTTKSEHIA